jgi:hypothetical protein
MLGSGKSELLSFAATFVPAPSPTRPRGRRTLISARVTPSSPGVSAVLQLRLAHRFGWWPVARAHLNRSSRVRFAIPRGRPHRTRVILTLADGATITATSRTFRVGRR